MLTRQRGVHPPPRAFHHRVGKVGNLFGNFRQRRVALQVPQQNSQDLFPSKRREFGHGHFLLTEARQAGGQARHIFFHGRLAMQIARLRQRLEPLRGLYELFGKKVALGKNGDQILHGCWRPYQPLEREWLLLMQPAQMVNRRVGVG